MSSLASLVVAYILYRIVKAWCIRRFHDLANAVPKPWMPSGMSVKNFMKHHEKKWSRAGSDDMNDLLLLYGDDGGD